MIKYINAIYRIKTNEEEGIMSNADKNEQKERYRLINELGDKLTQAQVLFADVKKLKEIKKQVSARPLLNEDDIINNPNLSKEEKLG